MPNCHCRDTLKYGAFTIKDHLAHWNQDAGVKVAMSACHAGAELEGMWDPYHRNPADSYPTALGGVCIWGKYDCMFTFKPKGKGNPGAKRSLANPNDKDDLIKRLGRGERVERIILFEHPFGRYQTRTLTWQVDAIARYGVEKLYYSLPLEEYRQILASISVSLPQSCTQRLADVLQSHHDQLRARIQATFPCAVEFIYPLRDGVVTTIEDSYTWPYRYLAVDLGIEEMEEVFIPYQAMKAGAHIPPILLGMLGMPCPYYERRDGADETGLITLYPGEYR